MASDPSQDFGAGLANTAQQTGSNAINSYDPTASANSVRSGFNNLYGQQTGQAQNFANTYASQVAANPQMTDAYKTAQNLYNVPQLASNANYLQNQVANQYPEQVQLARGFDVSSPQIDNATNTALRFLQPQATAAQNNLNTAQGLAQGYVTQQQTQNQMNLLPVQAQQQMVQQAMAAQSTGYNTAAQAELNGLVEKMKSGVQLSSQELDRANQLAAAETSYQNQITSSNAAITQAQLQNNYHTLSPSQGLFSATTGQITPYNPTGQPIPGTRPSSY